MRLVAHKFGVPPTTLHDHLSGKSPKVAAGGLTVLSISEEQEVAMACITLADMALA